MKLFGNTNDGRRRSPLLWIVLIGGVLIYAQYDGSLFENMAETRMQQAVIGDGNLGAPFALIDHTGRSVTDADFRGKHMLVYFGYSWSPDESPTDLLVIEHVLSELGEKADSIQTVFITLDPARDTPEKLSTFIPKFGPRLVGLTGGEDEIKQLADAYNVRYRFAKRDEEDTDYHVEYTTTMYLMGPDGKFVGHYDRREGPIKIALDLERYL